MKKAILLLLVTLLQLASSALAERSLPRQEAIITTSDYLLFLQRGILSKESPGFYDLAMSQQIIESYEGDHLTYSILQGEENKPLLGLTVGAATAYINWLANDCPSPPGHGGDGAISYPLQEEGLNEINSLTTLHLLNNDDGTFSIIKEPFEQDPSPMMMWEEDSLENSGNKKVSTGRENEKTERRSSNPSLREHDLLSEERIQADLRDHIQGIATIDVAGKVLQKRDQAYQDLKTARQKSPSRRRPPVTIDGDESSTSDINSDWLDGTIYRTSQMRVGATALKKATQVQEEADAKIKAAEADRDQAIAEATAAKAALEARVEADRIKQIERAQQMAIWEGVDQRIKTVLEKEGAIATAPVEILAPVKMIELDNTVLKKNWLESEKAFQERQQKQTQENQERERENQRREEERTNKQASINSEQARAAQWAKEAPLKEILQIVNSLETILGKNNWVEERLGDDEASLMARARLSRNLSSLYRSKEENTPFPYPTYWAGDLRSKTSFKAWAEAVTATRRSLTQIQVKEETYFAGGGGMFGTSQMALVSPQEAKELWHLYFLARAAEKAALNNQKAEHR